MVDWDAILSVEALDLDPALVEEVHAVEFRDWTDDAAVEITVVLRREVDVDSLEWSRLAPTELALRERAMEAQPSWIPYVRFMSREDWDRDQSGEDEEDVSSEAVGITP